LTGVARLTSRVWYAFSTARYASNRALADPAGSPAFVD
jgi:hypothetical protein